MTASFKLSNRRASSLISLDNATGPAFAPTAANFPSLKSFFKCTESAGASALADSITGRSQALSAGVLAAGAPANAVAFPGNSAVCSGSHRTGHFAMESGDILLVAAWNQNGYAVNSGWNVGYTDSTSSAFIVAYDSNVLTSNASDDLFRTLAVTSTGPATNAVEMHGLAIARTGLNAVETYYHGSAAPVVSASAAFGTISEDQALISAPFLAATPIFIYGIALFNFAAGMPGDVSRALTWMSAQWQAGNKVIWPYWNGLQ